MMSAPRLNPSPHASKIWSDGPSEALFPVEALETKVPPFIGAIGKKALGESFFCKDLSIKGYNVSWDEKTFRGIKQSSQIPAPKHLEIPKTKCTSSKLTDFYPQCTRSLRACSVYVVPMWISPRKPYPKSSTSRGGAAGWCKAERIQAGSSLESYLYAFQVLVAAPATSRHGPIEHWSSKWSKWSQCLRPILMAPSCKWYRDSHD